MRKGKQRKRVMGINENSESLRCLYTQFKSHEGSDGNAEQGLRRAGFTPRASWCGGSLKEMCSSNHSLVHQFIVWPSDPVRLSENVGQLHVTGRRRPLLL